MIFARAREVVSPSFSRALETFMIHRAHEEGHNDNSVIKSGVIGIGGERDRVIVLTESGAGLHET